MDWTPEKADFLVDGRLVRSSPRPSSYPIQMVLAVFEFPDMSVGNDADREPSLVVDYLRGYQR